jgi:hypothetical protein
MYKIIEKQNHLAVHGIFDSLHRAEYHLKNIIPTYIEKGYFMDKTLKPTDFEIVKG